jgi:hypothetical protein
MPTSVYFNNQSASREQLLLEDMIIETIKNHGIDIYYLPRESRSELDELFGDDPVKSYSKAFPIEMYLESSNDFEGNQEFFSKFGLEIQKAARVTIAKRTFHKHIPLSLRNHPKEGDLVYLPVQQKILEIKFVEEEKNFFQLGRSDPYMYGLSLEVFKYNGELFSTGIVTIDSISNDRGFGVEYLLQQTGSGTYSKNEIVYQGTDLANANARAIVSNWNKPSGKIILRNIKGEFKSNTLVKGVTSNSQWVLVSGNAQEDANDLYDDNIRIEDESDTIIDWSELNPFGMPNE